MRKATPTPISRRTFLVTLGVEKTQRDNYKLWEVGKAPELIVEVTSKSTRLRDIGLKKGLYEAIGVQEYLLFDPRREYLEPRFRVFRQDGDGFVSVDLGGAAEYQSRSLGLIFRELDGRLRVFDADGALLRSPQELSTLARESQARADAEAARANAEAARAERLAARLRELGIDPEE